MWHEGIPSEYRDTIVAGDARELSRAIPDGSVDLLFSDPPYMREYLPLYGWTAREAARVLRPGGWCLVMCGGLYLNQIFRMMDDHLTFFWKYEVQLSGQAGGCVRPHGSHIPIITRTKPLLAYSKGEKVIPRTVTHGLFTGTGSDKRYHAWGQDEASTRYYVDCFSSIGDVVLDPFMGGGTTGAMCKQLARHFIGFELDPCVAEKARERVRATQMPLPGLEHEQDVMAFEVMA